MVLRAALPAVICAFMVVGVGDHREIRVQCLQLLVRAVAGVAQAVIGERQYFALGENPRRKFRTAIISAAPIFIEIIAHVQYKVDVIARCRVSVSVEFAKTQI